MRTIADVKIYHWSEIQDAFKSADIFLGNGFSININPALNYHSLFERFLTYLGPDDQSIFKKFNSTNFEGIQNKLSDALEVNTIFGNKNEEIERAQQQLKTGLLSSIKDLHPNYSLIDPRTIINLSQGLDWFENIYTTNYDTFLYHVILTTLDRHRRDKAIRRFQDFFKADGINLIFTDETINGFRNIYYLHGALFLYKDQEMTIKIRRGSRTEELLDLIRLRVRLGNLPIFVSEGRASLKEETISRNKYLSFCRSAFRDSKDRLVIYGFSFSDSDNHLISDLNWNKRKLAIGLHLSGLNDGKILQKVGHIEKKLYKYPSREIKYFDSKTLF